MPAQTTYNYRSGAAVPGMPYSSKSSNVIRSFVAKSAILPGRAVEFVSGGVQQCQTATTGAPPANMIGVALYDGAREQSNPSLGGSNVSTTGYEAGEMVPVMLQGDVWVEFDGGGTWPATFGAVNVNHSSDGSHGQGTFTKNAPATTAGAEIDTCAAWVSGFSPSPLGQPVSPIASYTNGWGETVQVAPVTVNFPGHV